MKSHGMKSQARPQVSPETPRERWEREFAGHCDPEKKVHNRSGIQVEPLYTAEDLSPEQDNGFPGQFPFTRGIYPSMHRGRAWSQRQLIGYASPETFNRRQRALMEHGSSAVSFIPCNSGFRGYDMDEVDREILGTCGTLVNTVEDMAMCLDGIPLDEVSIGLNDPSPFTYAAFVLCEARRQGIPWQRVAGTSNQSDYISHFVANHMFFRLDLDGARRILVDHIEFMRDHAPRWNPISVVGQHMQQAGATPAEAMAFTLSSAIQYAEDCRARGMDLDEVLPRFSFFFDISISFFEEIAKFRAGRRLWAKITRDRLGAKSPKSWRFRFHAQTSGADLTRQQPLNNLARVTIQAMAGIFGGLQSLHTDAYDEALSCPSEEAARLAINTQNILREEAGLTDVIDPLGGSHYVECLTDDMEARIEALIQRIDEAGGMFEAVRSGLVQTLIGRSALERQQRIDRGEEVVVGVNRYCQDESAEDHPALERPDSEEIDRCLARLAAHRKSRDAGATRRALDDLAHAADGEGDNVFARVISAAEAGATHGEIVGRLRDVVGFGQPLVQI